MKVRAAKKPRRPKTVALTFDDGPSPYTPQVLDILRRNRVKATFCLLGNNVGDYRRTVRRIVREGHRICNHSRDHADFTKLSRTAARDNVERAQRKIRKAAGRSPKTFRFPYGASDPAARAVVRGEGLRILGWTVDTRDWQGPPAPTITRRAVRDTRPGAVILMHDGGGDRRPTVASLPNTIRKLKAKGYVFVLA
ncbi:polysaccharide deacetylase family protein [Actinoplanes sp. NBC_00393]|uniref:polysaccharide deacetylase family protein n=1 Tax=Actinoplanes sp. NBC_00393 TaxID=2975953 RepID=UPI002E1FAF45